MMEAVFKISINILTYGRREPYLQRLMSSLEQTDVLGVIHNIPIRLVPMSIESSYLDKYRNDGRFCVEDIGPEEASERPWSEAGEPLREKLGHYRCLHPERANADTSALLVLEDDVKLSMGWFDHLMKAMGEVVNVYGRRWLLSLYSPMSNGPCQAALEGRLWTSRPYEGFFGSQAILYPLGVRDEYMAYSTARPSSKPHDLMLSDVMRDLKIPILTTAPCLAQHTEVDLQGLPSHRSESFVEK